MIVFVHLYLIFLFLFIIFVGSSHGYAVTQECYRQKNNSSLKNPYCTRPETWIDKFDRLDSDNDGVISFTEYHNEDACFVDNVAHWFCKIDLDGKRIILKLQNIL